MTSTTDAELSKDAPDHRPSLEDAAPEGSEAPNRAEIDSEQEDESPPEYRKLYARMEAKVRRMCTPSNVSGRTTASPELIKDWREKGYKRVQLVKLMMEADGNKAWQRQGER